MKEVTNVSRCRICYYQDVKDDIQILENISKDKSNSYLLKWFEKMDKGLCTFHEDDRIATTKLPKTDCGCELPVCQNCFNILESNGKSGIYNLGFRFGVGAEFAEHVAMSNHEPLVYPHTVLPRDVPTKLEENE